ncbi:MAG: prepilin-type N-terminal cleavage/methylation domain-containing protein [Planctomycetes bacterium]|nr:prepilin-type N-terminal cleavage/methylation domain-containing protein [Planctomycetota bacterium]
MNKRKAFTLIELLVVISIIALLMSILMPSLSKAREQAQRLVCSSRTKDLMVGMEIYAGRWDGVYAPAMDGSITLTIGKITLNAGDDGVPGAWISNQDFRDIVGYKGAKTKIDLDELGKNAESKLGTVMSAKFSCPTNTYAKKLTFKQLDFDYGTSSSYGYNVTEWYGSGNDSITFVWGKTKPMRYVKVGHQPARIRRPAGKAVFLDSNDWWVHWQSANFETGWDRLGEDGPRNYNEGGGGDGPVLYRHGEGTNVTFYDGHVAYMRKTAVWKEKTDFNVTPKKPGMWVADSSRVIDGHYYLDSSYDYH